MSLYFFKYLYRRPQQLIMRAVCLLSAHKMPKDSIDNVLIISPHPDDEVFGCANLIYYLTSHNKHIQIIYLSQGEASLENKSDNKEVILVRKALTVEAMSKLGLAEDRLHYLKFPDGKFKNTSNEQIEQCRNLIQNINPDYIFIPHPFEYSPDHMAATEIIENILITKKNIQVYYYCVWVWHHMPLYKLLSMDFKHSFLMDGDKKLKSKVINIYTNAHNSNGEYYSGLLPRMFIKAISWKYELYFKKA